MTYICRYICLFIYISAAFLKFANVSLEEWEENRPLLSSLAVSTCTQVLS